MATNGQIILLPYSSLNMQNTADNSMDDYIAIKTVYVGICV